MSVTTKVIYLEDHAWAELKAALVQAGCTISDFHQADGKIKLYSDNGLGGHLDVVLIEKISKK